MSRVAKAVLAGLGIAVVVVLAFLVRERLAEEPAFAETRIAIGASCLRVEVADTVEKRSKGLKDRDSMGGVDGMIFDFSNAVRGRDLVDHRRVRFTMSEVRFPLTVGFYDASGMRVDAVDMEPCPGLPGECPRYGSKAGFRTAVETPKGKLPDGPLGACPS